MKIKKILPVIGGISAILLALWYLKTDFVHPWFAIAWGIIAAIGLFFTGIKNWWRSKRTVKLSPHIQIALILFLILVTIITTNWKALGGKDFRQWGIIIFTVLPIYKDGLLWAWSNLIKRK